MDQAVYERMDAQEEEHWWFAARREIITRIITRMIPLKPDARVLEAGCGTGGNLDMLGGFGTLDAFEYDEAARLRAAQKSGLEIPFGALPDGNPYAGGDYDLIALLDVLEHIEDDKNSLIALKGCLSETGRILITVPAMPWMWSAHDVHHHHFRRYTKASLSQVAEAAGLKVDRIFYYNSLLFPVAVAQRFAKKLLGRDTPDDTTPAAWLNTALYTVFRIEKHMVGRVSLPFGLSVCAVLKA